VFVTLRPGARLESGQILSIQSLIASAVPQLKPDTVSIVDSNGNLLARGEGDSETLMTVKAEEMRRNYERRMTQAVEDIVGRVVGYGHVRANVTADLNFDRISTNEELYDPETQVVRSSQVVEENNIERDPPSGEVSVGQNLPGLGGDVFADPEPSLESNRVEETTNYEISRTVRNSIREVGEVRKLSVAVLVDGIYTEDADGNRVYEPRSQQQLDQIASLVRSAIGYEEGRGDLLEVVNMQFADVNAEDALIEEQLMFGFERGDLLDAVEIITVAIMVILVILLVIQPMVGRLLATEGPQMEDGLEAELLAGRPLNPALAGPDRSGEEFEPPALEEDDETLINMQQVEGKVKASSIRKVEDIVDNYPNETVSVLRSWMSSEA
ncbi:MAG: flagellar basal-body MS-ring/collar protein FliF, partial [Pseudomonadota bacterium]|nr:flagellar basal-body MS-ring/collar protein FliF [Pseudomonadota bacterium]